ncbi:MAG: hypothetical protein UZ03_NOB001000816, partial [Nitrospira sp. OLB3]
MVRVTRYAHDRRNRDACAAERINAAPAASPG